MLSHGKKNGAKTGNLTKIVVAVVFTVGAEALELPRHKQESLSLRLIKEMNMILRCAVERKKR